MGLLDGIGGALSGVWNATVGQAVKAVTNLISPPPPPPAPPMPKDAVSLSVGATDWERSAHIIAGNTGRVVSNGGAQLADFPEGIISDNGASILSNNGASILSGNTANILSGNTANILSGNTANLTGDKGGS